MNGFLYVDGYYKTPSGRSKKWIRVKLSDVKSRIIDPSKNHDCYHTIQRFANPASIDGENQIAGLFFDLDAAGKPAAAKADAIKLINYFDVNFELSNEEIRVFFSGSKGFHVIVSPLVFGLKPHPFMTYRHKLAAMWLEKYLNLKTLDLSAYSIRRQWRIADSVHPKSSLYKIELTTYEVENLSMPKILKMAKQPRGELYDDEILNEIGTRPEAVDWYSQFISMYDEHERERKLAPSKPIKKIGKKLPVCIEDLMLNHIRKKDTRNRATMTLASFYKDIGLTQAQTILKLTDWILKVPQAYSDHYGDTNFLKASIPPVVKTVYENSDYHFLCNFARSLGNDECPVRCLYDDCPFTSEKDQEPDAPIVVHLGESSRVEYFAKKLSVNCIVSGKWDSPLIIPKKIRVTCTPNLERENSKCLGCKMAATGGKLEKTFTTRTNDFLNLIQCSEAKQFAALKHCCGIKENCHRVDIEILERVNVEEIQVIPQIENSLTDHEYVRRIGYFLGHGIKSNENYMLNGYSLADPRTQYVCIAFSEFETSSSSLTDFTISLEMGKELEIFRPGKNQSVAEKFTEIHKDLETNITRVWGRQSLATAFDLVYHSVLSFKFLGRYTRKGWAECLIIGDSGQAKSTVAETLMEHYDLGHKISGEGAGRTGLAYSITTTGDKWFVCVTGDTLVYTRSGLKKIKDCRNEKAIWGRHGFKEIEDFITLKNKPTLKITLHSGLELQGTYEHPILTPDGFRKLEDLGIGDVACVQRGGNVGGNNDLLKEEGYLLGLLIGDGDTNRVEHLAFYNTHKNLIDAFCDACKIGIGENPKIYSRPQRERILYSARLYGKKKIAKLRERWGLEKLKAAGKVVPTSILTAPRNVIAAFLKGYLDSDGNVFQSPRSSSDQAISYSSMSKNLLSTVQILLLNFGIVSLLRSVETKTDFSREKKTLWALIITGKDIEIFKTKILGIKSFCTHKRNPNIDRIHHLANDIKIVFNRYSQDLYCKKEGLTKSEIFKNRYGLSQGSLLKIKKGQPLSYSQLEIFVGAFKFAKTDIHWIRLKQVLDEWLYYDKVVKIENAGKQDVYDFVIPDGHNFISNGIISHNCWGALPLNDRRLVVIDEMSGIAEEEIAMLSELRSTGVVEVRKVVSAKTNARTRLIMMSNARNGYPLNTLTYPVTAIVGLIPKAEDIRRLDFAVGVMTGEVPTKIINRHPDDIPKVDHVFTSYYCKTLILWAWTRSVEQVVFTKDAEMLILKKANMMGLKYSPKIPLVEPADQRLKLARLSAAVAARVFSSSDDYETLVIKKEHVEYAHEYLEEIYSAPALAYAQYSGKNRPVIVNADHFDTLFGALKLFPEWKILANYILDGMYFTPKKITEVMGYEKDTLNEVTKFFIRESIVKSTSRGYRVTEMGIDFLKRCLAEERIPF